ncbi:MAG: type I DNA topoisomerase [Meiothermus sp.]|uniref:type I DNA topoisomerase n=1 Tax=Meiothermus sp. TaxID=1955249 RepID=UPI0025DFCFBE|nr:type I DNA topoisomerase [Meiothermus sp.]MCS7058789.1 type I DNA topoisomerase [Meiothermus sp.]MCS7195408.1 type I DNA topoisomerase [Meiothermus sp.]MDW8090991.1 type I DNA topoisomerase [Meiothermus sp.]MDW8482266.1 type I DNA topoisomerase [Meiothermus sp.]
MPDPTLVVVESPAKAKSIQKMLGPGYEVRASKGHVADLPEHELGVDVEADFTPHYEVKKDKQPVVQELKRAAQGRRVLIATDPDREGEAIGWHVARLLNLDPRDPMRVEFHEITPRVVQAAVQRPRPIDQNLVNAQQARRVLDRLVGYQLSPVLSMEFRRRALSAGRVQSVALRLLVEREEEIERFQPQEYWTLEGWFESEGQRFAAELHSVRGERVQGGGSFLITSQAQAQAIAEQARAVAVYQIGEVERRERRRNPPPPFTTSTLQQAASTRLGWTAGRTMRVAQRLYEGVELPEGPVGLITYMRTDSTRVSQEALAEVRRFIPERFGPGYLPEKPNQFAGKKAASAQDAHEAIRPTAVERTPEAVRRYLTEEEFRLYQLIWQRFVASQMTPAVYDQTTASVVGGEFVFRAVGSVLKFDGFLRVYGREEAEEAAGRPLEERRLPPLREKAPATLEELVPEQHFTEPPPRYTDASLVKTLEEMGIGRPSTYAPTIETLERRSYIERQGKALKPTPLGREVTHYLIRMFPDVVAYDFTAQLEARLDEIEEGKAHWPKVVREFYEPFLEDFQKVPKKLCPECGRPLELKVSRFGQFLGCTGYPECRYTERLEPRKPPEPLGEACPQCGQGQLVRRFGRYGSFISCDRYPACTYTRDEAPSTGLECPKCRAGEVVRKTSKRGRPYYRCNNPACDFLVFDPPQAEKCPLCGWNELDKGKSRACSNPACERYGGPRTQAKGRPRAEKKTSKKEAPLKASWAELEAFLPLSGLTPEQAEVARLTKGQQKAVPQAASALGRSEAETLRLFRQAMFRLRMEYGKARKAKEPVGT